MQRLTMFLFFLFFFFSRVEMSFSCVGFETNVRFLEYICCFTTASISLLWSLFLLCTSFLMNSCVKFLDVRVSSMSTGIRPVSRFLFVALVHTAWGFLPTGIRFHVTSSTSSAPQSRGWLSIGSFPRVLRQLSARYASFALGVGIVCGDTRKPIISGSPFVALRCVQELHSRSD